MQQEFKNSFEQSNKRAIGLNRLDIFYFVCLPANIIVLIIFAVIFGLFLPANLYKLSVLMFLPCFITFGFSFALRVINRGLHTDVRAFIPTLISAVITIMLFGVFFAPNWENLDGFEYSFRVEDNGIVITKYIGQDENITVPKKIYFNRLFSKTSYNIIKIDDKAFDGTAIESIDLSLSAPNIGENIFDGCDKLQSIILPSNSQYYTDFLNKNPTLWSKVQVKADAENANLYFDSSVGIIPFLSVKLGDSVDLSSIQVQDKIGYSFSHWTTDLALNEAFDYTSVSQSEYLYAVYAPNINALTFDANGGEGEMEQLLMPTDSQSSLSKNLFFRTGYDFCGWSNSADSQVMWGDEELYIMGVLDSYTIYAVWSPISYTITYKNLQGGTNPNSSTKTYTIESNTINLAKPSLAGYDGDWDVKSIPKGSTGNKTITAVWSPITYSITYLNLQGGTNPNQETQFYTIESETISFESPVRKGYNGQWDIEKIEKGSVGDKEITAIWSPIEYYIKYNANGGTGTMPNGVYYYDQSDTISDSNFARAGYDLRGWSLSADGDVDYKIYATIYNLSETNGEVIELFAVWKTFYSQGDGTKNDPFIIKTSTQFNAFMNEGSTYSGIYIGLGADIDLTSGGGSGFVNPRNFAGNFDGNGYKIKNYKAYSSVTGSDLYFGLFRQNSGTISNLGLESIYIYVNQESTATAGGFVAYNTGTITNCYASGTVKVYTSGRTSTPQAGGFVGYNAGEISDCYSKTEVEAVNNYVQSDNRNLNVYAGGFACENAGIITNCFSSGSAMSKVASSANAGVSYSYVGGFVGRHLSGSISSSFTTANVSSIIGSKYFSHSYETFVGNSYSSSSFNITNCYSYSNQNMTISDSTNGTHTSKASSLTPVDSYAPLKTASNYNSASFYTSTLKWSTDVWDFSSLNIASSKYPTLKMQ